MFDRLLTFILLIRYFYALFIMPAHIHTSCSLHDETLYFWTLFVACFLDFLFFTLTYWQINAVTKQGQRKSRGTRFLTASVKLCASVTIVASASVICGWWSQRSRRLSFEVRKNGNSELICLLTMEFKYLRSSETRSSQYVRLNSWEAKLAKRFPIIGQNSGTEL